MTSNHHPGWINRHWRWFAPTFFVLVLLGAGIWRVVTIATNTVSVTDLYQQATAQASHDPAVIADLGQPISGSLRRFNAQEAEISGTLPRGRAAHVVSGTAVITVNLSGPRDVATLHIRAQQGGGHWHYQLLSVDTGHQQHIDLLQQAAAPDKHI